jgi:5-methylcytosine-specific restriction protein A
MPDPIPHRCNYPGCPERTTERFCALHRNSYNHEQRRPGTNADYGRRWRTIRNLYISQHPLCELCQAAGRMVPATEVHHRVPLDAGGTNHDDNLQALCKPCHSRITLSANRHGNV